MSTQYVRIPGLQCPVCPRDLNVGLTRGRKSGKPFLMVVCPVDGRHFRGFINDRAYIEEVVSRLEQVQQMEKLG